MKKFASTAFLVLTFIYASFSQPNNLGVERIEKIRKSVVSIIIDGKQEGTGFFVSNDGKIATCWHVVSAALYKDSTQSRQEFLFKKIEIQLSDNSMVEYGVEMYYANKGITDAILFDYCLLVPKNRKPKRSTYDYLVLGNFSDINDGDAVYSAGYPLNIKQQLITTGILSTKWVDTITWTPSPQEPPIVRPREVAWLDLNLHKGNSGSPIIKFGSGVHEDRVIGIHSYNFNPMAQTAQSLIDQASLLQKEATASIFGMDLFLLQQILGEVMTISSFGVAGCVSIDYFKSTISER